MTLNTFSILKMPKCIFLVQISPLSFTHACFSERPLVTLPVARHLESSKMPLAFCLSFTSHNLLLHQVPTVCPLYSSSIFLLLHLHEEQALALILSHLFISSFPLLISWLLDLYHKKKKKILHPRPVSPVYNSDHIINVSFPMLPAIWKVKLDTPNRTFKVTYNLAPPTPSLFPAFLSLKWWMLTTLPHMSCFRFHIFAHLKWVSRLEIFFILS